MTLDSISEPPKNAFPVRTLYLSGPMRSKPDFNYPRFNELAAAWRKAGYNVLNPAESFGGDTGRHFKEYMRLDIEMVLRADLVLMLDGWQNSEGARTEWAVARAIGTEVRYENEAYKDVPVELEAATIVRNGAREKTYGHPGSDFARTGQYWGVPKQEVALRMVQLKLSRLVATPDHRDSVVDAIGYLICYSRLMLEGQYGESVL